MVQEIGLTKPDNYNPGAGKETAHARKDKDADETNINKTALPEDKVTVGITDKDGNIVDPSTYSRSLIVEKQFNVRFDELRAAVARILEEQGITTGFAVGDKTYDIRNMTPEEAQSLIAADGFWGVDQTSERISQFAISAGGNDPSRLDRMKEAIKSGFAEAKEAFGGWLPDISEKTLQAALEKLDKWAAEAAGGLSGENTQQTVTV